MKSKGHKVEVLYGDHSVYFESWIELSRSISMSVPRIRSMIGDKRVLSEAEFDALVGESYKPAIAGCRSGEKRPRFK